MLKRIISDYFMTSRFLEYEQMLELFIEHDYKIISLYEYYNRLNKQSILADDKILINRHDIDTDIKTARRLYEIENKLGVTSSFYFRLNTLDINLMKEIHAYGSEASYHFEELASYAKQNKLYTKEQVLSQIDTIKQEFTKNFQTIENKLGFKIQTIASHGDFANRKLEITNHPISDDLELRNTLGIQCEAYDKHLMNSFDIYLSDRMPPQKFVPMQPEEAIHNGHHIICMLTHPRQWYASWIDNTRENITRFVEGIQWSKNR